jgi:phosphate transport system substrate-binding protein
VKKLFVTLLSACTLSAHAQVSITGAGATFPAPVYSRWAADYHKETGNQINYSSIGSSGGIRQMEAKTTDFGASDDPVSPEDLVKKGWQQFPAVIGGIVVVVNLKGFQPGEIVLDGQTVADIYEGKILNWNHPQIAKLNPKLKLPDQPITVVVRADGSGTTAVFTDYLAQVSSSFKDNIGVGKTVNWKLTQVIAGKGNAGVAAMVQNVVGGIGYVEYAFAKQGKLTHAAMLNKGKIVQPDDVTFKEAASSANWNVPGLAVNLNNRDGWPITAATFILLRNDGANNVEVIKFFDWAFTKGNRQAEDLDYVPLPDSVKNQIRSQWARTIK